MHRFLAVCLFLLPFAGHAADLRGLWVGYYAYGPGQQVEAAMVLEQLDEKIAGLMIERQTFGDEIIPGLPSYLLEGKLSDDLLSFQKHYAHQEEGDPVVYRLMVSTDGRMLTGFWSVGGMQGTATFHRAAAMEE